MNTYTPVPPPNATPKYSKTHRGCNVRTVRFTNDVTQCLVEEVTLADGRDIATVAFTQESLDRIMRSAR